jgi:hypothetical protein
MFASLRGIVYRSRFPKCILSSVTKVEVLKFSDKIVTVSICTDLSYIEPPVSYSFGYHTDILLYLLYKEKH